MSSCQSAGCSGSAGAGQTAGAPHKERTNEYSSVKRVIGVVSGKGGVGKSLVTSLLATEARRTGAEVAILDADITGPSIPKIFGVTGQRLEGVENAILPAVSHDGIKAMSINLLLERETDPVLWRGPVIGGAIKQFWSEVAWGEIDYMFVDMPPGTGDVALTVFQSLPVDGLIIVTSPQDLVSMIVAKAVKMADAMNVPVLGLVENLSYLECPDCGTRIEVFGKSHIDEVSKSFRLPVLGKLGINPELAELCDKGEIHNAPAGLLDEALAEISKIPPHDDPFGPYEDDESDPASTCSTPSSACSSCPSSTCCHKG